MWKQCLKLHRSTSASNLTQSSHHLESLADGALAALLEADLDQKVALTNATARKWFDRTLSLRSGKQIKVPDRPGRPEKPELLPPRDVPKRPLKTSKGRVALIHAIAHIELNAIDLALDIIVRFADQKMPRSFFDGWMRVAQEEAKHFTLLRNRLADHGMAYGDLPAHDGLWEAAGETGHDITARLLKSDRQSTLRTLCCRCQ